MGMDPDQDAEGQGPEGQPEHHLAGRSPGDPEHGGGDQHDHQPGPQVRLQEDRDHRRPQHHQERHEPPAPLPQPVSLRRQPGGQIEDHDRLDQLRGLEGAVVKTAAGAQALFPEEQHGEQRKHARQHQRDGEPLQPAAIHPPEGRQAQKPQRGGRRLAPDEIRGISIGLVSQIIGGVVNAHEAQHDQQGQEEQEPPFATGEDEARGQGLPRRDRLAMPFSARRRHARASTRARKWFPRSSKSR